MFRATENFRWCEEFTTDELKVMYSLKRILASGKSKFQNFDLVETGPFGRILQLDGKIQSAEFDEHVYHESLVHPAMLHHPNPKTVFVGGGGEGATVREVLRHKTVERVVMVDIDQEVVEFCKEHLPANREAFADPRLEIVYDDAKGWLERSNEKFDVIIGDLADPLDGGPCYMLYTRTFYEFLLTKINDGGIFVTQSTACGALTHKEGFSRVYNTMRQVFASVVPCRCFVDSFIDCWGFNIGFTNKDATKLSPEEIEKRIAERVTGELKYLDGEAYLGIISLPKDIRATLASEKRLFREEDADSLE